MIVDTSFVVALVAGDDAAHQEVSAFYATRIEALVTSPLALAEMDSLLRSRAGDAGAAVLYDQLERAALRVEWSRGMLYDALEVARQHPAVGLADASLVALAAHERTTRIATLDQRHFRAMKPLTGEDAFTILPADA